MEIRPATITDAAQLSALVAAYVAESFPGHLGTSAERLATLLAEPERERQRILLAIRGGRPIGFIAWDRVFDLHWGKAGAQVADLYVEPPARGHGIALALVAAVCAAAQAEGASFLRGGAYDRSSATGRFYERIAVAHDSAECHCSGRAFRRLAELAGQPARQLVRGLPPRAWNYEP
jgi:GNAT superfamily N-acetyltransferase